jgi:hypothetical protein
MEEGMEKESITIQLKHPIEMGSVDGGPEKRIINSVTVGRLKVKHLKHIPSELLEEGAQDKLKSGEQAMLPKLIPMLASMCGLDEAQMDEMDTEDMMEVTKQSVDFMGQSLKIGEK